MKKTRVVRRQKPKSLKISWPRRVQSLQTAITSPSNPVVKASYIWGTVSEQLYDIFGEEIHRQWFKNAKPLVIADQSLIIELPNQFATQWIHAHYQELIDVLIGVMDKNLSVFFISRQDLNRGPVPYLGMKMKVTSDLVKNATSEIDGHSKND